MENLMAGRNVRLQHGPLSCTVSANVDGGQLVEAATDGTVIPAAAGSTKVLGVALTDARPEGTAPTDPLNTAWPRQYTSVACNGEVKVTYSGQAVFGDLLVAADNGQVAPVGAGTADTIIGRCTEPGGASGAGVTARAWIRA